MGFRSNLREKCLLVKEKWPIVLTRIAGVCYRHALLMPQSFAPLPRLSLRGSCRVGVVVVLGLD